MNRATIYTDDFVSVREKPFTRTLDRDKNNQFRVSEKLFTYGGNYGQ